jgi:FkbM family methyltransferase
MRFFSKLSHQFALLFKSPYNKKHPLFAFYRFIYWNVCKVLGKDFHAVLWGNKFKFWISSHQSYWLFKNYYLDTDEFNLIKEISREDDIVFDIGANIGIYSIWFAKCINGKGKVYAFEPDQENFKRLNYALSINEISSVMPVNVALSNSTGDAKFSIGLDEQNALINEKSSLSKEFQMVSTSTIDNFCSSEQIDEINYMKIDVEGAEWFVLNGANEMLFNKRIKIIQLEINSQLLKFNINVEQLHQYMLSFGYNLYRLKSEFKLVDTEIENLVNEESNNYYFIADMEYIKRRRNK